MRARHTDAVYTNVQDLAFVLTYLGHSFTHRVSELFYHSSSKSNPHELIMDILLGFDVSRATIAFCFECDTHFFEPLLDNIKLLERFFMQMLNLLVSHDTEWLVFALFALGT